MKQLKKKHPKVAFILKLLMLALPLFPVIAIYFYYDPDMILHKYKRFDQSKVMLNEAYIGWQNYMQNKDSLGYDSFILGNSCTMAFKTEEWEKHLDKKNRAVRFFDNAETIGGIFQKIEVLDSVGAPLHNILIVVDANSFTDVNPLRSTSHLFSPKVAGISNLEFYSRFLVEFLRPSKGLAFAYYAVTGKSNENIGDYVMDGLPVREPYSNNFINPREGEIIRKGESYWIEHKRRFRKKRDDSGKEDKCYIFTSQIDLLERMNRICKKHHSNVKIIIGPDYQQKKANLKDVIKLKEIFGDDAVWDFTGINEYTNDYHNYYDPGHYRPFIGARLLNRIYSSSVSL